MDAPRVERRWVLTAEAFDKLLACLHPEREHAGAEYGLLQCRLMRFFEGQGSEAPEDDTDETLNRLARKVAEGEDIRAITPFAYGIARFVCRETRRRRWIAGEARRLLRLGAAGVSSASAAGPEEGEEGDRDTCWGECLDQLPATKRELLEEYYREARSGRREWREALAVRRGLSLNALRIQVYRIKEGLRACAEGCLRRKQIS